MTYYVPSFFFFFEVLSDHKNCLATGQRVGSFGGAAVVWQVLFSLFFSLKNMKRREGEEGSIGGYDNNNNNDTYLIELLNSWSVIWVILLVILPVLILIIPIFLGQESVNNYSKKAREKIIQNLPWFLFLARSAFSFRSSFSFFFFSFFFLREREREKFGKTPGPRIFVWMIEKRGSRLHVCVCV